MEIVFDVAERSVLQTGAARFRFRVVGAAHGVALRVELIERARGIVVRIRPISVDPGGADHELTARPRRRRRMPAGTHVFRMTLRERDGAAVAAADAVLKVVPCLHVEDPMLVRDDRTGATFVRVGLSSRCGCAVRCAVGATYGDRRIEGPGPLAVGLQTVHVELPIPLDVIDGRTVEVSETCVEVVCDDGTVIRRRPGGPVSVTRSRHAGVRAPRRGRLARMAASVGEPGA